NPKREAAAWEFVKWVTSPEMSAYWAENTGYIAPRKSAQALVGHKEFLRRNPMYGVAAKQMKYVANMPATKSDSIIYKPFSKLAQKLEADANVDIRKELSAIADKVRKSSR
ncbi:MAG TPA: extracellular solute-binding protein, partial [Desulfobacterales bacterium]|nr:extracellular solute-binding protein [Desulfobacterales bacterium]